MRNSVVSMNSSALLLARAHSKNKCIILLLHDRAIASIALSYDIESSRVVKALVVNYNTLTIHIVRLLRQTTIDDVQEI